MTRLSDLFDQQGQSPWLDNLTRPDLHDGTLADLVARGVRGVTANPTIVPNAIEASDAYDQQFEALNAAGRTVEDAYWDLAVTDVIAALEVLRPTFDASDGSDGFVSIEVARPEPGYPTSDRRGLGLGPPKDLVAVGGTPGGDHLGVQVPT